MNNDEHSASSQMDQNVDRPELNQEQSETQKVATDPSKLVDPLDLVYSGGFDGDPQEILGNPAVAPEMLSEGRDLRVDLFRETEEASPDSN